MTSQRYDRFLILLGAVLIIISSYQLFISTHQGGANQQILGTLASAKSVVKTKNAIALDWRDAFTGNDVTENQLIYTDKNSEAQIKFKEGDELLVGESSLIKIQRTNDVRGINVARGFIRAKLDGEEPLLIEMNGEEYKLSGSRADVQINMNGDVGEIGVLTGKVQVEKDGRLENLDSSSALEIKGEEVSKRAVIYQLIQPTRGQRFHTSKANYEMTLSWAPGDAAKVIISKNAKFSNPETIEGSGSVTLNLSPSTYYWKVEGRMGNSLTGQFTILSEVAPKIIRPKNSETVLLRHDGVDPELLLQWEGDSLQKYLVEWEDHAIHREVVQGPRALIKVAQDATIRWKVKIENFNRPEALWSEAQNIQVSVLKLPELPQDLFPHEVEFQTYEKPNETVEMKWTAMGAVEWELISPTGKKEFLRLKENSTQYIATEAGEYKWRVRSTDNFSRTSNWSDWKTFSVVDLSNEKSTEGYSRIQLKRPDQQVEFSWNSEEGTISVFELAKDSGFTEIISKQEVTSTSTKIIMPEIGTFYWRSRQLNNDGTIHVSEPKKIIIEPAPQIIKPEKLPDVEVPIEWKEPKKSTSLWDLIIPRAFADDLTGTAQIKFPSNENAKSYLIRIYRDEALTDLVLEKEIPESQFQWEDVRPGKYYWQYAIIDHWKRKSEFSDPSLLSVLSVNLPQAEKPTLLMPTDSRSFESIDLFTWTVSKKNNSYTLLIAKDSEFQKIIKTATVTKGDYFDSELKLTPGEYFWRVEASNKWKQKALSRTARFTIGGEMKLEKVLPEKKELPPPVEVKKKPVAKKTNIRDFQNRVYIGYAPSMDNYTFQKGVQKGDIDGQVLNGAVLNGTYFANKFIANAELLRQSGKVFEKEEYLFQRASADAVYSFISTSTHRFGVGAMAAHTSGQEYEVENSKPTAQSVSTFSYGVVLRDYYRLNEAWEIQSKIGYLLGDIKQLEAEAVAIRHFSNFFAVGGLNISRREYKLNAGKQSSMRVVLGLGKEF